MKLFKSVCTGLMVLLSGCSSGRVEDYADKQPAMDIRKYFNGPVEATGIFLSHSGKMELSFKAQMMGKFDGNEGTLEEHFIYSDGRKQERVWTIHFTDDNHLTATAHDVIGVAHGSQFGNAVNMNYVLAVPTESGSVYNMTMDDWMFRMDKETVLNHIIMKKFGFTAGELFITFKKHHK